MMQWPRPSVESHETLETSAVACKLTDAVKNQRDDILADVDRILTDELLRHGVLVSFIKAHSISSTCMNTPG